MASHDRSDSSLGKNLRTAARFLAVYGRLPSEFPPAMALGLSLHLQTVEADRVLAMAKSIAIAMGDSETLAKTVYESTGNEKLARNIEIQAQMNRGKNG